MKLSWHVWPNANTNLTQSVALLTWCWPMTPRIRTPPWMARHTFYFAHPDKKGLVKMCITWTLCIVGADDIDLNFYLVSPILGSSVLVALSLSSAPGSDASNIHIREGFRSVEGESEDSPAQECLHQESDLCSDWSGRDDLECLELDNYEKIARLNGRLRGDCRVIQPHQNSSTAVTDLVSVLDFSFLRNIWLLVLEGFITLHHFTCGWIFLSFIQCPL